MIESGHRRVIGQAKILSPQQQATVIAFLETNSRYPIRDICIYLFTVKAGLRANEVALLEWAMVFDLDRKIGDYVNLPAHITKGRTKSRKIPMHKLLKEWLVEHFEFNGPNINGYHERIFLSERGFSFDSRKMTSFFWRLYKRLGFYKCSSHSGRRTFITNAARQITRAGGSLRDVQDLVGHKSLATTQLYIEVNEDAKRKVVDLI